MKNARPYIIICVTIVHFITLTANAGIDEFPRRSYKDMAQDLAAAQTRSRGRFSSRRYNSRGLTPREERSYQRMVLRERREQEVIEEQIPFVDPASTSMGMGVPEDFKAYAEFESPKEKELLAANWVAPRPLFSRGLFWKDLGPDRYRLWELTRKSEIDHKMPQYGTYERWEYDMVRFPKFAGCFPENLTEEDWFEKHSFYEYTLRHYLSVLWNLKVLTRPRMRVAEKHILIQRLKAAKVIAHIAPHYTKERQRAVQIIEELREEMADPESYVAKKNRELKVSQSGVSFPRYIMLRGFGPPFNVEVLTTEGKWLEWDIIEYTDDAAKHGKIVATSRERWKYFGSDDLYYFTEGKLTAYEEEKGNEVRIGMPYWEVSRKRGSPSSINRTVLEGGGGNEQWVYGNSYLYFSGGLLDAFQD